MLDKNGGTLNKLVELNTTLDKVKDIFADVVELNPILTVEDEMKEEIFDKLRKYSPADLEYKLAMLFPEEF